MDFILHAVQTLLCLIDECIYNIASMFYSLLIYISESNIFDQNVIQGFATRLYALLGVFMLFKVSFSLINYIVNPDDFTKGEKGVGKLIPNVMISLVLIVFTPRIFAEVMDLQHLIISQHFFEKVIFSGNYESYISQDMGDIIAVQTFNAFYYYDEEDKKNDGRLPAKAKDGGVLSSEPIPGTQKYTYVSLEAAFDHNSPYNAYDGIWDDTSTYTPLISTAAGIILLLVLIQFCFDIAIRTVKFGFLQLIAPIPIISRMDPKSSKNGLFSRWVKECIGTYVDLFVRLLALFFAVYIIQIILNTSFQVPDTSMFTVMIVKAMLIIGTLLFAKQLPKFLKDLFNINLSSGFTLNPMKRLREVPGANRVGGALGSAYQRAVGTFQQQTRDFGTNRGRAVLRALGSGARGLVPGAIGGRGFRGQMTASRSAMNDLNEAAYKIRQENPDLTHEEALKLARRQMREDRRNERFGLETRQDRLHKEESELGIRERAHEIQTKKFVEEEEEKNRLAEERIAKSKRELDEQKKKFETETKLYTSRNDAMKENEDADKAVTDIAKAKVTDPTKNNSFSANINKLNQEQSEQQLKLQEYEKRHLEMQNKADTEIDSREKMLATLNNDKSKIRTDINNIDAQYQGEIDELTKKMNGASVAEVKEKYKAMIDEKIKERDEKCQTKIQEEKEIDKKINNISSEISSWEQIRNTDVKDTDTYKDLTSKIKKNAEAIDKQTKMDANSYADFHINTDEIKRKKDETYMSSEKNLETYKSEYESAEASGDIDKQLQAQQKINKETMYKQATLSNYIIKKDINQRTEDSNEKLWDLGININASADESKSVAESKLNSKYSDLKQKSTSLNNEYAQLTTDYNKMLKERDDSIKALEIKRDDAINSGRTSEAKDFDSQINKIQSEMNSKLALKKTKIDSKQQEIKVNTDIINELSKIQNDSSMKNTKESNIELSRVIYENEIKSLQSEEKTLNIDYNALLKEKDEAVKSGQGYAAINKIEDLIRKKQKEIETKQREIKINRENIQNIQEYVELKDYSDKVNIELKNYETAMAARQADIDAGASETTILAHDKIIENITKNISKYTKDSGICEETSISKLASTNNDEWNKALETYRNSVDVETKSRAMKDLERIQSVLTQIESDSNDLDQELIDANNNAEQKWENNKDKTGSRTIRRRKVTGQARYKDSKVFDSERSNNDQEIYSIKTEENRVVKPLEESIAADEKVIEELKRSLGEYKSQEERFAKKEFTKPKEEFGRQKSSLDAIHKAEDSSRSESTNNGKK